MTDREALELDPLARWKSKDQLLKGLQDNQDEQTLLELQRALGMLSPGTLGEADFVEHQFELKPLMDAEKTDSKSVLKPFEST